MKKTILLLVAALLSLANWGYSQNSKRTVQGQPYEWSQSSAVKKQKAPKVAHQSTAGDPDFTRNDVKFWVGNGSNEAFFVVEWHDGKIPDALVWGYRWDGTAYGIDMLLAIAKADPRFYCLIMGGTQYGSAIAGLGYDIDRKGAMSIVKDGITYQPVDGFVNTSAYDFDSWTATDKMADHWNAGWYDGYWSYWVKDAIEEKWNYSGLGASSRQLTNGSWDGWSYLDDMSNWEGAELGNKFTAATQSIDYGKGTFFVNEDWFGHNNSTVNFLDNDGNWNYRVFQTENPGRELGCTSQFGTIYGGNMYIVSKQDKDPGATVTGSRLAVANARTMQVTNELANFGENTGDGRAFLGVDENTGYIGSSAGIYIYNIPTGTVTGSVSGIPTSGGLYSGQIGNMVRVGNRVFAVRQSTGVYVINPNTHTIETTIAGNYGSIIMSKDGNLWLSPDESANAGTTLVRLNPYTLATTNYKLPAAAAIPNSWYAWTADGFCASNVTNHIYWKNNGGWFAATKIYKLDASNPTQEPVVIYDSKDAEKNEDTGWGFYGAGFRINPVTDEIFASMYKTFASTDYKVLKISADGDILDEYPMAKNYWFPAMPVFPDNYAPVINTADLKKFSFKDKFSVYLGDKITDVDNFNAAIVKSFSLSDNTLADVSMSGDTLYLASKGKLGNAKLILTANSNGKLVSTAIDINIIDVPTITLQPENRTVVVDEKATFAVEASGGDLTYQWYKNGTAINGAIAASYSINQVKSTDNNALFRCVVKNSLGEVTSENALLTTEFILPEITKQPVALVRAEKAAASFSVTARGGSVTYQWYKDNVAITTAKSATYSLTSANVTKDKAGAYHCVVTNSVGSVSSEKVTLTVLAKAAIKVQPSPLSVAQNSSAVFEITATGDNLEYQWYKDNTEIEGAVNANYAIASATEADSGVYHCVVKNAVSIATSSKVTLSVSPATGMFVVSTAEIAVYPNPFADYIIVNSTATGMATIYSLSGKVMLNVNILNGNNRIETSALPKGVYVLKVGESIAKIVK